MIAHILALPVALGHLELTVPSSGDDVKQQASPDRAAEFAVAILSTTPCENRGYEIHDEMLVQEHELYVSTLVAMGEDRRDIMDRSRSAAEAEFARMSARQRALRSAQDATELQAAFAADNAFWRQRCANLSQAHPSIFVADGDEDTVADQLDADVATSLKELQ